MGAEALCRGAALAIGVEQSGRACQVARDNWQQVAQVGQEWRVLRGDVLRLLPALAGQSFDRIYFDPPYASDLYEPVLAAIANSQLLAARGEIAVEHDPGCWQAIAVGALALRRQKHYGRTSLAFYGWRLPGEEPEATATC